jgi:hypothetical protein
VRAGAFGSEALLFACAYAVVRAAHIVLFMLASREDQALRQSVLGLAASTAIGAGLLFVAAFTSARLQLGVWGLALVLDAGGPFLFGADGWKLVPGHFAERHGAIVIIALGESIVAIGVGARATIGAGVVLAAVLAIVIAAALWWVYFDVAAIVAGQAPGESARGARAQRDRARLLLLSALSDGRRHRADRGRLKRTITHVDDPLKLVAASALLGGAAMYCSPTSPSGCATCTRSAGGAWCVRSCCCALLPAGAALPALATLAILAAVLVALIAYEALRYADVRDRVRHQPAREPPPEPLPDATAVKTASH